MADFEPHDYGVSPDFDRPESTYISRVFWVEWFHKAPHINLTLSKVNSTFDPFSDVYQESLGIIGCVPAVALVLSLIVLLLYLISRCCDNRKRTRGSIICLKVSCFFMSVFTLGAMAVSGWGNDEVHKGVSDAIYSIGTINNMVESLSNKTKMFDETIQRNLEPELNLFRDTVEKHKIRNNTARLFILENLELVKANITDVLLLNVDDIRTKLNRANLSDVFEKIGMGELIRWIGSYTLTGLLMVVVFIVPCGVLKHSRCTLITFSVLGLISLIVCWVLTSVYFVVAVGISDWCMNPNPFMEWQLSALLPRDVALYYVRCDATRASPFTRYLTYATHAADAIEKSLEEVTRVADDNYPRNKIHPSLDRLDSYVEQCQRTLGAIAALLECQSINRQYLNILSAMCDRTVSGIVYMLFSAAGSAFLLTILVWISSHTWIYLNKKSKLSTTTNNWASDTNRVMNDYRVPRNGVQHNQNMGPRPRHSHTPPHTPPFAGTLNGYVPIREPMNSKRGSTMPKNAGGSLGRSLGPGSGPAIIGSSTMGRGGHGHSHNHPMYMGPNHGQYATLSKQCKTLESSDFY